MKDLFLVFLFSLFFIMSSCNEPLSNNSNDEKIGERSAAFVVHVVSAGNGQSLEGVEIKIDGELLGYTESDGKKVVYLYEGDHTIVLKKENYRTISGSFYSSPYDAYRKFEMY